MRLFRYLALLSILMVPAAYSHAQVAVGIGVGANGLVGGANSFTLQPLSVQGEVGLNVVATVTVLNLEPVLPARHNRHYRRHRH